MLLAAVSWTRLSQFRRMRLVDRFLPWLAAEGEVERVGEAQTDAGDDEERHEADLGRGEGEEAEPGAQGDEQERPLREAGGGEGAEAAHGGEDRQRDQDLSGLVAGEAGGLGRDGGGDGDDAGRRAAHTTSEPCEGDAGVSGGDPDGGHETNSRPVPERTSAEARIGPGDDARERGFEPRFSGPKPDVLPLDDSRRAGSIVILGIADAPCDAVPPPCDLPIQVCASPNRRRRDSRRSGTPCCDGPSVGLCRFEARSTEALRDRRRRRRPSTTSPHRHRQTREWRVGSPNDRQPHRGVEATARRARSSFGRS